AGNRGASGAVLRNEILDDLTPEFLLEIEDVERDSQSIGHGSRVIEVARRAAAPIDRAAVAASIVELHRETDDLLPRLLEKQGRPGGVHTAAHGHHRSHRSPRGHSRASRSLVVSVMINISFVPPRRNSVRLSISLCETFVSLTNTPLVLPRS